VTDYRTLDKEGRERLKQAQRDLRAMRKIADAWNQLSDAGKDFILGALKAGRKK
jgi:hypothetical protein